MKSQKNSIIDTITNGVNDVWRKSLPEIFPVLQRELYKPPERAKQPVSATTVTPSSQETTTVKAARARTSTTARIQKASVEIIRMRTPDDYDRTLFVCKACSRGDSRPFASVIHVEPIKTGSRLIGTDGKRMHVAEIKTVIKPGNYKPRITKDSIGFGKPVADVQFPNWTQAVPETVQKRGMINLAAVKGTNTVKAAKLSAVSSSFKRQTGETINRDYLEDLPKIEWGVYTQAKEHQAFILRPQGNQKGFYAVMVPYAA